MCRQGCEFDTLLGSYSFPSNRDSCSFFLLSDYVIPQSLSITIVYRRLSPAGIQLVFIRDLKIRVQGRGYEDTQEIDTAKSFIVSFFTIKVGTHIFIEGGY